jgi:hypothetical protein
MMIATWHDALPFFGYTALLLIASSVPVLAAIWTLRAQAPRRRLGRVGRHVVAAVLVVAGLPLYAYTALLALLAIAAIGCAPDAYECPV